ncbi:hypothetical protein SAMN05216266_118126 [Amycolatopsis marina]|uniref:PknH-like extracellular domain-containing protein n=1 Tax=Amycolatopsis marina TaxID=490629 RepID=A0A1I1BXU5_9PSEU|nr:hypothetical protein [Amycolatopsis marina]SFB55081.1 hypothetical protein SAMN05216266_118126 [Amycolatopsis marina]
MHYCRSLPADPRGGPESPSLPEVETVRHGRLFAVTAIALAGLSGCADRPNDLDTYYEDPTQNAETSARTANSSPRPVAPPVTTTPPPPPIEALTSVVLTDADVAAEGVSPADTPSAMEGCLAELQAGRSTSAGWRYPTGSELTQHVLGFGESTAAVVEELRCADAEPLPLTAPEGTTAHQAWCAAATCTVVLSRDELVSAVQVAASSPDRAAEAAVRLAPVVGTALARESTQR